MVVVRNCHPCPRHHFIPILIIGAQCMEAAFNLLDLWLNYMHSLGHTSYAPDFFFVGTGFASAFLLEVCCLFTLAFPPINDHYY
jgi:hypothetical protein